MTRLRIRTLRALTFLRNIVIRGLPKGLIPSDQVELEQFATKSFDDAVLEGIKNPNKKPGANRAL